MECKKSKERRLIINRGLGGNLPFSCYNLIFLFDIFTKWSSSKSHIFRHSASQETQYRWN